MTGRKYKVTLQMDCEVVKGEMVENDLQRGLFMSLPQGTIAMLNSVGVNTGMVFITRLESLYAVETSVYEVSANKQKLIEARASEMEQNLGKHGHSVYQGMWDILMGQLIESAENLGLSTSSVRIRALLAHIGIAFMRNRKASQKDVFLEKASNMMLSAAHVYKLVFSANGEVWYKGFDSLDDCEKYAKETLPVVVDFETIGIFNETNGEVLVDDRLSEAEIRLRGAMVRSVIGNNVKEVVDLLDSSMSKN